LGDRLYSLLTDAKEDTDTFTGIDGVKEEKIRMVESFSVKIGQHTGTLNNMSAVNRQIFPSKNKQICGLFAADIIQGKSWTIDYFNQFFEIQDA